MPQVSEKRMLAYAETNPQVVVRYHSVPDGHVDEPALVVLGQLLNDRTGRLYRALVEEQGVATRASGGQSGFKFEGMFELRGTAAEGHAPEEVEQALYAEMERLKTEPVDARELQKVKNQNAASTFRELQGNFFLMYSLLMRDANRGWETINSDPPLYDAVTADDIMRVANTYFEPENRAVAVYYRKASDEAPDPRLAGLDPEEQEQIRQMQAMIGQFERGADRAVHRTVRADVVAGAARESGHGGGRAGAPARTPGRRGGGREMMRVETQPTGRAARAVGFLALGALVLGANAGAQTIPAHPSELAYELLDFTPPVASRPPARALERHRRLRGGGPRAAARDGWR